LGAPHAGQFLTAESLRSPDTLAARILFAPVAPFR
jgi:hypothetical protein